MTAGGDFKRGGFDRGIVFPIAGRGNHQVSGLVHAIEEEADGAVPGLTPGGPSAQPIGAGHFHLDRELKTHGTSLVRQVVTRLVSEPEKKSAPDGSSPSGRWKLRKLMPTGAMPQST
jgi:hypothetical protein